MNLRSLSKTSHISLAVLSLVVISGGLALSVSLSQQQQDVRSSASVISGKTYRLVNKCGGKVAAVAGSSKADGGKVITWDWANIPDQKWKIESIGGGYYRLINVNSGKALQIEGASTTNGADAQQWGYFNKTHQHWAIQSQAGGYYKLIARHSGKALEVTGGSALKGIQIQQWASNTSCSQQWQIIDLAPAPTPTGALKTCTFVSDASNKVVGGGNAVATYKISGWTASIPGATWIWSSYNVATPTVTETKTFTRDFYVKNPVSASVAIASDNRYWFSLNGTELFSDLNDINFTTATQDTYNLVSKLTNGMNAVEVKVQNNGVAGTTAQTNPAGLLYNLTVTAEDCGNQAPAVTPTSGPTGTGGTLLNLDLLLHGIGKGGDNVNPQSLGNLNPLHQTRTVTVEVYNAQNVLVDTKSGQVTYASDSGSFKGTVAFGSLATGIYSVKVKADQYLKTLVPGIQNITANTTNTMPKTVLIAGDVNGDNQVSIIDYNILMGCYSDLLPAVNCTEQNKLLADLTDDGSVNQFDYNLFIREISNLPGQ